MDSLPTAQDSASIFEIAPSYTLNQSVAGRQVVYGNESNKSYYFLQEMSWADLASNGDQVGLFTQIPGSETSGSYSGWVCTALDTAADSYQCTSHYVDQLQYPTVADFSTQNQIGDWACSVAADAAASRNIAFCANLMPEEANGGYDYGKFRWDPTWGQVEQWGYRRTNGVGLWIKLGKVTL